MKLAEALVQRADLKRRLAEIQGRLTQNARVQEGEQPYENPDAILREMRETLDAFRTVIQQINRTNSASRLEDGRTLTDALAAEQRIREALIKAAAQVDFRYSRSEIKQVATVDVAEQRRTLDSTARALRELDLSIQRANWQIDLIE